MNPWSTRMSLISQRAGGQCEATLTPTCTTTATYLHNRCPGRPISPATHLWVCDRCNTWIGSHHTTAKQLGWWLDDTQDPENVPLVRLGIAVHLGHDGTMWPDQAVTA